MLPTAMGVIHSMPLEALLLRSQRWAYDASLSPRLLRSNYRKALLEPHISGAIARRYCHAKLEERYDITFEKSAPTAITFTYSAHTTRNTQAHKSWERSKASPFANCVEGDCRIAEELWGGEFLERRLLFKYGIIKNAVNVEDLPQKYVANHGKTMGSNPTQLTLG